MIVIESKDNSFFKQVRKLKEKRNRVKENKYLIEGFRLVQEGFKVGIEIENVIIDEDSEARLHEYLGEYVDAEKVYMHEE